MNESKQHGIYIEQIQIDSYSLMKADKNKPNINQMLIVEVPTFQIYSE